LEAHYPIEATIWRTSASTGNIPAHLKRLFHEIHLPIKGQYLKIISTRNIRE
jgi:hypothetical protein